VTAYHFLSWARQGLAAGIPTGAAGTDAGHAVVPVTLHVRSGAQDNTAPVNLRLYGPGDVVGIDARQVIRSDPAPGTGQFEPNYFPAVEFDAPEYPWLFTPDGGSDRLRPWLVLVVVRRAVGTVRTDPTRPLPWLDLDPADAATELPDLADSWAWAHAQLAGTDDDPTTALAGPPERTLSRLLCPRRLDPGTPYLACVVPAFLAGRQAGLGLPVIAGGEPAWPPLALAGGRFELPVYHQWEFSTGPEGDFESLARRLVPRALGPGVGSRPMDLTTVGSQVPVPAAGAPGSVLGLEGALMSPDAVPTAWPDDARVPFQERLTQLLSTVDDTGVVRPPVYGSREVTPVPQPTDPGWLWTLNLDPRYRAAAGLGAQVVAARQEQLVAAAWDQAGDVRQANTLLHRAQLARAVGASVQRVRLAALPADAVLRVTQPVHSRVRVDGEGGHGTALPATLLGNLRASAFPPAAVSAPFRRAVRPAGPVGRRLPDRPGSAVGALLQDLGAARVGVPLKPVRGATAFDRVDPAPDAPRLAIAKTVVPGAAGWSRVFDGDDPVYPSGPSPFQASPAAETVRPAIPVGGLPDEPVRRQHRLSGINERFRNASKALFDGIPQVSGAALAAVPAVRTVALTAVATTLTDPAGPLAPDQTVPAQVLPLLPTDGLAPAQALGGQPADPLVTRAAVPSFDQAMAEPLQQLVPDALLPGAELVEPDTAGLLVGNPRFIESYLVGLNDALSAELFWRGLPTDYGATYFRQFWDIRGAGDAGTPDINAIADWPAGKALGDNAVRVGGRGMIVLLIRGELLRRYPHTVVYAVRADTLDGAPDVRYPEFRGRIDPDLTYLGFGLGLDEARGGDGGPGWYFVLQEQPTAPRFGLDALPDDGGDARFGGTPTAWDGLHWGMLAATPAAFAALRFAPAGGRLAGLRLPLGTSAPVPAATWGVDAAQTAAITFQRPVRVAIHASTMLAAAGPDRSLVVTAVRRTGGTVTELGGVDPAGNPWRMDAGAVADAIARGAEGFVIATGDRRPRLTLTRPALGNVAARAAAGLRDSALDHLPELGD
jgi:hypothetical protein